LYLAWARPGDEAINAISGRGYYRVPSV
jgi:hypothetical protein